MDAAVSPHINFRNKKKMKAKKKKNKKVTNYVLILIEIDLPAEKLLIYSYDNKAFK